MHEVLLLDLVDDEGFGFCVVGKNGPADCFDIFRRVAELFFEGFEIAEIFVDLVSYASSGFAAAFARRSHVRPKHCVKLVAAKVEAEVAENASDVFGVFAFPLFFKPFQSSVGAVHVCLMMFGVVKRHDFGGNHGLQSVVRIRERWKSVFLHGIEFG